MDELILKIKEQLLRRDGRLNSAKMRSNRVQSLIQEIREATYYLPKEAGIAQRWWHILNGIKYPTCKKCGNDLNWDNHSKCYKQYCSQKCAVTSEESRTRARITHLGRQLSAEQRMQHSIRRLGYKHSESTKQKLSELKRGSLNPSYGKAAWNRGLIGANSPNFGKRFPGRGHSGPANSQYGKSPSKRAGKGIWGKFNGIHFRSSLELFYLIFWFENNVEIKSAESSEYRVEYLTECATIRTYSPDFLLLSENKLVEIKPENLHNNIQVQLKFKALQSKHIDKVCELIGFKPIGTFIRNIIHFGKIDDYIQDNLLIINEQQLTRLKKNYADIIRATV